MNKWTGQVGEVEQVLDAETYLVSYKDGSKLGFVFRRDKRSELKSVEEGK